MIYVAPFLGEFGWEVALWRGWVASQVLGKPATILCRPGHQALYRFEKHHRVVPCDYKPVFSDCQHAFVVHKNSHRCLNKDDYVEMVRRSVHMGSKSPPESKLKRALTPPEMPVQWKGDQPTLKGAKFPPLGSRDDAPRVLLHVRRCADKQPKRNWDVGQAAAVAKRLQRNGVLVMCIGTRRDAAMVGGRDMRDAPISELVSYMGPNTIVVGPSSGPMHLAQHCGCPIVVWSGLKKSIERYNHAWNPHSAPVKWVGDGLTWDPAPGDIFEAIMSFMLGEPT